MITFTIHQNNVYNIWVLSIALPIYIKIQNYDKLKIILCMMKR